MDRKKRKWGRWTQNHRWRPSQYPDGTCQVGWGVGRGLCGCFWWARSKKSIFEGVVIFEPKKGFFFYSNPSFCPFLAPPAFTCLVLSCLVLPYLVIVLSCLASSCDCLVLLYLVTVLSCDCLVLSCLVLSLSLILSCLVLSCLVLSCLLSCLISVFDFVLSCLVLSCHVFCLV